METRFYGDSLLWRQARIRSAPGRQETPLTLTLLFDRLCVLRNQVLHSGATWNSSVNCNQVRGGAAIMGFLVPISVKVMMDHTGERFGGNHYPVVNF